MLFSFYRIDSLGIPWLLIPTSFDGGEGEWLPPPLPGRCLLLSPSLRAEWRVTGAGVPQPLLRHLLSLYLYTVRGLPPSEYEVEAAGGVLLLRPPVRCGDRYALSLGGYDRLVMSAAPVYAGIALSCRTLRWQEDGRCISVLLCQAADRVASQSVMGALRRASAPGGTWVAAAVDGNTATVRALCGGDGLPVDLAALGAVASLLPELGAHTGAVIRLLWAGGCVEGRVDAAGGVTLLLPVGDILRGRVAWEPFQPGRAGT